MCVCMPACPFDQKMDRYPTEKNKYIYITTETGIFYVIEGPIDIGKITISVVWSPVCDGDLKLMSSLTDFDFKASNFIWDLFDKAKSSNWKVSD